MACPACKGRSQRQKIVPVIKDKKRTEDRSAQAQGATLRNKLRYTGR